MTLQGAMKAQDELSSVSATFQPVLTTDALMSSSALQKGQCGVWGVIWLFPETFDLSNTKLDERPAFPRGFSQGGETGTVTECY